MNILVAGATGLIGREVVRALKGAGHFVRTLSRDPSRAKRLEGEADEVLVADATQPGALDGSCDGIEIVVSALGAPVSPNAKTRQTFGDVDRAANLALLDAAKRAGVRRFVYVGVYTLPIYADTAYVDSHTQVEAAVRASGLEHGFVRPTGVFGALAELVDMAKKGPIPLIGDGSATTNPVHEAEVAEAVLRVVTDPDSSEIDIGGPETLSRRRIGELAFRAAGKKPRLLALPVWLMRAMAFVIGPFNRRMSDFLRFIILASTTSCLAPLTGKHALGPYFEARAAGDNAA